MGKYDILGIGKMIRETEDQYVNKNMLGNDACYVELAVKNMKLITNMSGDFVKLILNWPGYCFDADWVVVPETPELLELPRNQLGPNETQGRRYIGLPGINKVVDYPFSWETFIRVNPDGTWEVKSRPPENVKQALCEAVYFMLFNVKTKDGYSINIGVQFGLRIKNGLNVFYGVSVIGRWINKFHSIAFSTFNEFALKRELDSVRKDITKDDEVSDIKDGLDKMENELIRYTGHVIDNFDIVGYNWDRKDPMFIALENVATAKQEKLALIEKQKGEQRKNIVGAEKIRLEKEADAAGDVKKLKAEYEAKEKFVTNLKEKNVSEETIQHIFISDMDNLLSISIGESKSGLTMIKNVDDIKNKTPKK